MAVLLLHPKSAEEHHSFAALSLNYPQYQFRLSSAKEIFKRYEIESSYAFVVFRDFDEGQKFLVFEEEPGFLSMEGFLEAVRYPFVMEFTQETAQRIFQQRFPTIFYFHDDENTSSLMELRTFAKDNKEVFYAHSTTTKGYGAKLAEHLAIDSNDTLVLVQFEGNELVKYRVDSTKPDVLKETLKKFKEKTLEPYIKSEEPVDNTDNLVKVVCSKDYEKLVTGSGNFVLLELYAPWCPHCQKLEPIYEEVAKNLSHVEDLTLAKMDFTKNEVKGL